jgi:hypothetical protein
MGIEAWCSGTEDSECDRRLPEVARNYSRVHIYIVWSVGVG